MYEADDPRSRLAPAGAGDGPVSAFGASSYGRFSESAPQERDAKRRTWYTRGQNFVVCYSEVEAGAAFERKGQADEYVLLLHDHGMSATVEANGETVEDTINAALEYQRMGYKAIRIQSGVPGLASTYGVSKDKLFYEPADADMPTENVWSTSKYMRHAAGRLGKDLEPYRPFWMEDAVAAENQQGFEIIRQHTTTPLAVGEIFNSIWDCKHLIENHLIDYIRATVVHAGGLTHLRRIASFADMHHVRTGCHGATDLSPVCMAAALHFGLSVPNFGVQEYMRHTAETDAVFPHSYSFADGALHPGEAPGLGVDIDESLAEKYPYSRAYLPVNRLEDGSMFNW